MLCDQSRKKLSAPVVSAINRHSHLPAFLSTADIVAITFLIQNDLNTFPSEASLGAHSPTGTNGFGFSILGVFAGLASIEEFPFKTDLCKVVSRTPATFEAACCARPTATGTRRLIGTTVRLQPLIAATFAVSE
jgi:hypothetical protein